MNDQTTVHDEMSHAGSSGAAHDVPPFRYRAELANDIETRWQSHWEQHDMFRVPNPGEPGFDAQRPPFYVLDMFPYPSGAGLHVGHPVGYVATDIVARYQRLRGCNVLHPMGWDAFGLPAEQYAIQTGIHPAETTRKSIDTFRRQLKRFGFSYDWSREFATIDPEYYKWTQWIWLKAYHSYFDPVANKARPIADLINDLQSGQAACGVAPEQWQQFTEQQKRDFIDAQRLAYLAEQTVNWCPKLGTALANEEVIDGRSERGSYPVYRKPLRQWMFRITAYADRLLAGLEDVDWPESTRTMQAQWIGRSEGAVIEFQIASLGTTALRAVTAQSDTISGNDSDETESLLRTVDQFDPTEQYLLQATGFVPRNPFPKGENSPNDLDVSRRNLPHIVQRDATYFVSWRARSGVMLNDQERSATLAALTHWDGERCRVFATCVMPDHVHLIVQPKEGHSLGELCESVKRYSARQINELRQSRGSIWDAEQFDHIVRDEQWLSKFIFYLALNPIRAGLSDSVAAYPWTFLHSDIHAPKNQDSAAFIDQTYSSFGALTETHGSESRGTTLNVFTTRPDTIFGATYMVVAPEHPVVEQILTDPANSEGDAEKVRAYVQRARNRSDVERQESKEKTGEFTGGYCINPATGERIGIWVADYVLMGYGTGAIMAVPGHDERDFAFARTFNLPIPQVVQPAQHMPEPFAGEGICINSSNDEVSLNGLATPDAKVTIIDWLERTGRGQRRINYKLRDWLFSRQRYWGEPFPIVFDEQGNHYPVSEAHLPVVLPPLADYEPIESDDPLPLLAKATDWVHTTAGEAGVDPALLDPATPVRRETNTMPGWAGSCWYYLRYCDPRNHERFMSPQAEAYWMRGQGNFSSPEPKSGVDLYIGGAEHAVLHLLYARFWHMMLHDLGEVTTPEPFQKLFHQGLLQSYAYQRSDGTLVPTDEVEARVDSEADENDPNRESFIERATGQPVTQVVAKMSKSLKNVVNPDDVIHDYGADTFRLYEMYMGPLEASKPWNMRDIVGPFRFLQRVWRLVIDEQTGRPTLRETADTTIEKHLHRTIARIEQDIERLSFNTAIAAMIEFINAATSSGGLTADQLERFTIALSPFAPHIAEELWHKLGRDGSILHATWPAHDPAMLRDDEIELPVQIMGKVRGRIVVSADADAKTIEQAALTDERIAAQLQGLTVRKVVIVPGKIINIVAN